jgi:excisionase family DNA binding protein
MIKNLIQIETINSEQFKREIVSDVINALKLSGLKSPDNNDEIYLTRQETAKLLSVSLVTIWDWTKKDVIPAFRIGSKIRYKKSDVLNSLSKKNQF